MSSRDCVEAALKHRCGAHLPVDFGASPVTGMHVSVVYQCPVR